MGGDGDDADVAAAALDEDAATGGAVGADGAVGGDGDGGCGGCDCDEAGAIVYYADDCAAGGMLCAGAHGEVLIGAIVLDQIDG